MKKKIITLMATLLISSTALADYSLQEAYQDYNWMAHELDTKYNELDSLYYYRACLLDEIGILDEELGTLVLSIGNLKAEIQKKEEDIAKIDSNLVKANNGIKKQYEDMKKRIQYIYENGEDYAWIQLIFNSDSLIEVLNKAEFTQEIYKLDREKLVKFQTLVKEIEDLKAKREQEVIDLEELREELSTKELALRQEIENKTTWVEDYSYSIYDVQSEITDYSNMLLEQEEIIAQLEYEEYLYQLALQEQQLVDVAEEEEVIAVLQVSYDEEGEMITDDEGDIVYEEILIPSSMDIDDYVISTSSSGQAIVDFATQFVGNPYVWGGTSLTNGADCSGFVQSVYANYGIDLPRTSYDQESAGREVSYAEAQPGDLIVYDGHVAIYMGNGQIVHASNERDGIKISDNAQYRTILSVRRLVD